MGKGGGTQNVTQTTKVELPAWVDHASRSNYNLAKSIAAKPYQAYGGQEIADMSPDMLRAFDLFRSGVGAGSEAIGKSNNLLDKASGGLLSLDREQYMNPYVANVENAALGALNDSRIQSLMGNADKATASKAFGGSRSAIVDAVTNAEAAKGAGQISAGIRSDAFNSATNMMQGDLANWGNLAGQYRDTASQEQTMRNNDFSGLMSIGGQQQAYQQSLLDNAKGNWEDMNNYDTERLNLLLSSLGMSPYGKTETSTKTVPKQGTDWASVGTGIFSLLGGIFSDENAKTDIEKLGNDPTTGLDIFAYRYKNDPKTYPKVVGPMAQDIAKKFPNAVRRVGGKLTVKAHV